MSSVVVAAYRSRCSSASATVAQEAVIEEADIPQVHRSRDMESEQRILRLDSSEFEEAILRDRRHAAGVLHQLATRKLRLGQQRFRVKPVSVQVMHCLVGGDTARPQKWR